MEKVKPSWLVSMELAGRQYATFTRIGGRYGHFFQQLIAACKMLTLKAVEKPEVQERRRHTPISGPILAEKAKYFYKAITKKRYDFVASCGWLYGFKGRHGIKLRTETGEKLSND